jgi:multiple sugar transport system permease protein
MIPQISLSLAFYNLFHHLGLLDSYPGLILADSTGAIPFFILVVRAYLSSIPPEIMDAAAIDGCSELRTLRSIILPMAVPGIVTASVFVFLMGWSDFIFALTLTIGGHLSPLTVGLYRFIGIDVTAYGPIMATVVFAAIPSGIMLAFAQRYIMGGLRAGALKG